MADPLNPYGGGPYQGYLGYGDPGSFSGSEGRRKIIAALLAKQRKYPTTIGEGIASVGENVGNVLYLNSLADEDKARGAYEANLGKGSPTIPVQGAVQGTPQAPQAVTQRADTSPIETVDTPYVARGAAPGEIPLPPPRPRIDSSGMAGEFDANPTLAKTAASMVNSENPAQGITQLETARNRAIARGTTVEQELQTLNQNRNAYYPQFAKGPGDVEAFKRNVLTPVLRGSDVGGQQLGFSPTGNASDEPGNPFASRNLDAGRYNIAGHVPGNTEMYVQRERPGQLARLDAARVPGRDAIATAMMPTSNVPDDAGPPSAVRTASLTPAFTRAGYSRPGAVPPVGYNAPISGPDDLPAGAIPLFDSSLPVMNPPASPMPIPPAGATAQAPYANPPTTAGFGQMPDLGAIAGASTPFGPAAPPPAPARVLGPLAPSPGAIEKAPARLPSQEPVPAAAPPYVNQLKRPDPLGISPEEDRANRILSDPRIDPNGPLAKQMQQVKIFYEARRKEQEQQQQAEYVKNEQRAFDAPSKALDEHVKRVGIEKAQADLEEAYYKRGLPRQQAAEQARLDILKAGKELRKPDTLAAQGTHYQQQFDEQGRPTGAYAVPPGLPPPEKKPLTTEQAKAVTFVRDVLPDMDLLETKLNHGAALANSALNAIGSSVPLLGNVLPSQEYLDAQNALGRFKGAVMQHLSGAAVSPSEAERNLPAFIPRYGDSKEEVLKKAERRRNYVNAVADTAGDQGVDSIDKGRRLVMEANSELPPVAISSMKDIEKLGAGQRVIVGIKVDGQPDIRTVPWPKHLLPK